MNMHPVPRHSHSRLTNPEVLEAFEFAAQADAPNTQRAYLADWKHFIEWCKTRHRCPLPVRPDDLALYLRYCAEKLGLKISTVQRRVSAISEAHARNGHLSPAGEWVVRNTMRRLRRDLGAPARGKNPVLVKDLKAMLAHCPPTLAGRRDKAILLVGFCGAFRRSDLVNLDIEDLAKADEGLVLMVRKGKTDQKREGRKIGIPYGKDPLTCPVRALCEWIAEAQITSGPLFAPSRSSAGRGPRASVIASSPRSSKSTASELGNEFRCFQATRFGPALPPPRRSRGLPRGQSRSRRAMPASMCFDATSARRKCFGTTRFLSWICRGGMT